MTPPADNLVWSRRKWAGLIFACFLVHVAIIWLLGERPQPIRPSLDRFQVALDEGYATIVSSRPDFEDPSLLALPSLRGFSAAGWLDLPSARHEYHEWTEEQRWLAIPTDRLGEEFVQYVRSLTGHPPPPPEKAEPVFALATKEIPADWLSQCSHAWLEGPLAARFSGSLPELPAWPHKDVLHPTVAEVMADEKGRVLVVTLIAESGSAAADEQVVKLAEGLSFTPIPPTGGGLATGLLGVRWATSLETNAPALTPAP